MHSWGRRAVALVMALLYFSQGCARVAYAADGMQLVECGPYGRPYMVIDTEEQIREEIYDGEREELAQLVEAEAGNQSLEGKQLVADVVLNRVADPDFPNTIHDVIFQKGQFSVIDNGMFEKAGWNMQDSDYEAVRLETENERLNTEVLYFSRGWSKYGTRWKKVGDHCFSTK